MFTMSLFMTSPLTMIAIGFMIIFFENRKEV
ncbi:hypothetical protein ACSSVW_003746 [Pseudoalteromonas sp. MBR-15]